MLALIAALQASPVEFYGFGARRMGRAGGGTAIADGPESVLSNPASLPGLDAPELSLGIVYGDTAFRQFPDLYWDTNQDGLINSNDSLLDMGPNYNATMGVMVGAAVPLGKRVAVGLGLYLPPNRLLRLQTFEPQLPSYFLYENRTQRYELGMGLGVRPIWGLSLGAGLQMIPTVKFALDATLNATVSGAGEEDSATELVDMELDVHSMVMDLKPGMAPNLAFHWDAGQAVPVLDGLFVGASWRGSAGLPVDADLNIQANIKTADVGELEQVLLPLVLNLQMGLYDHYVPSQWNFGLAYSIKDRLMISADLRRTGWDKLRINIAEIVSSSLEGAAVDFGKDPVKDGNPYDVELEATWAPRVGADLRLPEIKTKTALGNIAIRMRAGFGYEPTPLVSQSAATVVLDADRIIFGGGLGVEHLNPFWRGEAGGKRMVRWDGFLQYHMLATGELVRPEPAQPTAGYAVGGAAIPIGGHLLAAGAQWSLQY